MLLKDLVTVAQNARWLPTVLTASESTDATFRRRYAEDRFVLASPVNATKLLKAAVMGQGGKRSTAEIFDIGEFYHPSEQWIFVNGICTDRTIASLNASCLSDLFQKTITVIHNPTRGIIPDLVECVFERTFDRTCDISLAVFHEVMAAVFNGQRVKLIGHSQGGIIVSRVLQLLKQMELGIYKNIEVYTFGSGADEDVLVTGVRQEHFVNAYDFVSRIGMRHVMPDGALYEREIEGHLLNRDYLEHFAGGHYCGKNSRLYSYVRG